MTAGGGFQVARPVVSLPDRLHLRFSR